MKTFLLEMLAAQSTFLQQPPASPLRRSVLLQLTKTIPPPVLAHYLRLVEHGHVGVAVVRHGVCSGCHLRLPSGQTAVLVKSDELHLCENCGSYLLLPPEEDVPVARRPVAAAVRRRNVPEVVPI
ncbi:MAG: hypothetical protein HZC55_10145 [Verrucomicrobia bacterium]|nr:hypothetical protein [Verrucomicrobiota bacterium]